MPAGRKENSVSDTEENDSLDTENADGGIWKRTFRKVKQFLKKLKRKKETNGDESESTQGESTPTDSDDIESEGKESATEEPEVNGLDTEETKTEKPDEGIENKEDNG